MGDVMRICKDSAELSSQNLARAYCRKWLMICLAFVIGLTTVPSSNSIASEPPMIILVGGMKTTLPDAEHDFPDAVLKIGRLIAASPDIQKLNPNVKIYPVGFPTDLTELDGADVVVLYGGLQRNAAGSFNPLQEPAIEEAMNKLMDRGAGLVALHQSFTVPADKNHDSLSSWLGGVRISMLDYTTETAPITLGNKEHPILNGLSDFELLDEFYPSIEFAKDANYIPLLNANIHVQHRGRDSVFEEPASERVVAWAHERKDGGRAFAFSGGHNLRFLDQPQVRRMVLNAIVWATKNGVPQSGVTTSIPTYPKSKTAAASVAQEQRVILKAGEVETLPQTWGELQWFASRPIGNSTTMTVGRAIVTAGKSNPPHWHPNCDEILYVAQGHIMHRVGDKEYEMRAGDTVVIPEGTVHNARNIGTEDAILMVSFNSADRVAIGE